MNAKPNSNTKLVALSFLAIVSLCLVYFAYVIWDWAFNHREYYIGRFLLTATVEVDGELKSGSSVYEVSYNARRRGGGFGSSPINGARGTMPMIDLGEHGILAFTFRDGSPYRPANWRHKTKCEKKIPERLPTYLIAKKYPKYKNNNRNLLKELIDYEGPLETSNSSPQVAVINNKNLGKDIVTVFCIIDRVVDEAIKPVSISIETTELPLDNENPFLNNDVGNEILNVLGGGVWRRCFNVSKHSCPPGEKIEGN